MAEPSITVRASYSSFTPGDNLVPIRVVVHATNSGQGFPAASRAGTALDTANYFASGHAGGSAHYVCDLVTETHCVPDDTIAYHAPPNERSIGIEICADGGDPLVAPTNYSREQWLSPQCWPAVARAANRTRELCDRFGIPIARLTVADLLAGKHGICGHVDVSQAWHESDHSDPGLNFPWPEFMALVGSLGSSAAVKKKDLDVMKPVQISYGPDGSFRGSTTCEQGATSAVIQQAWLTFGVTWTDPTPGHITSVLCSSLAANGQVIDQKHYELANNCSGVYDPHPQVRQVTIEGKAPNQGALIAADLVLQPK